MKKSDFNSKLHNNIKDDNKSTLKKKNINLNNNYQLSNNIIFNNNSTNQNKQKK
jgi:hypothetical protein